MKHNPMDRRQVFKLGAFGAGSLALAPILSACRSLPPAPPPRTAQVPAPAPQLKFTPALLAEIDRLAKQCVKAFDTPGAALALMQDGEVVYAQGFGVRNFATGQPFTPDTVHRIASTSKSMSAMLVAMHVDDGAFGWDTPVHEVWPAFRLPTDELTQTVTVRQLMGMGTGIGGNPIELYADLLTPEVFLAEPATLPVISPPGQFFYQNDLYALAAYLRDLKHGVAPADLVQAYAAHMKTRLFEPMGMPTSTVSDDPATVSDNYAVSYGYHLPDGIASRYPLPFEPIRAAAPAGSVCTTLNDMARYVLTQLGRGVAPGGTRVVSEANLTRTWQPQTKINETASYAMGWFSGILDGMQVLNHSGSADAFKTDMTLLPDRGLGMLMFTNSESGSAVLWTLTTYILDVLSGKTSDAFERAKAAYTQQNEAREQLRSSIKSVTVDRAAVKPSLGDYEKGWRVEYADGMAWLTRASGYRLVLLPLESGYLIGSTNSLSGFGMLVNFIKGDDSKPRMTITQDGTVIDSVAKIA